MVDENRIREIAHDIWAAEGYPVGQDDRHWRMATEMAKEEERRKAAVVGEEPSAAKQL